MRLTSFFVFALFSSQVLADSMTHYKLANNKTLNIKTYGSKENPKYPPNEQPFYGFISTEREQPTMEGGARIAPQLLQRGLSYIGSGEVSTAAKRFNQAWLVSKNSFHAYYGMALIVKIRDNDNVYADYLFSIAKSMNDVHPIVYKDHALTYLERKNPKAAISVVNAATKRFGEEFPDLLFVKMRAYDSQKNVKQSCLLATKLQSVRLAPIEKAKLDDIFEKCK